MDNSQEQEEPYVGPERREHWPAELDVAFWRRLYLHMTREDKKFAEGSERMAAIERDLQPIKKMYWAIVGSAGIGSVLLCLLTYIYLQDKNDFRIVQQAIVIQGEAIQRLMVSQQNLEQSYHRDVDRLERGQDRIFNQGERK